MHRDIKPANIYIRSDGSPVLLDFGAARQDIVGHSRSVTSLATPGYAAFEQYSTKGKQGPWTDIYGLAATLYRAVTGEKPQDSPDRILEDSLVSAVKLAGGRYDERLLRSIDAGMSIRPEQRPQTIAQWRELIVGSVKGGKSESLQAKHPYKSPKRIEPIIQSSLPPDIDQAVVELLSRSASFKVLIVAGLILLIVIGLIKVGSPPANEEQVVPLPVETKKPGDESSNEVIYMHSDGNIQYGKWVNGVFVPK
jgi:serine/threonine protein kinase